MSRALSLARGARLLAALLAVSLAGGCSSLLGHPSPPPQRFVLDAPANAASAPRPARPAASAPVLIVAPVRAAAGFDSTRLVYVRQPHRLDAYADHQWADTPARMLTPLLVDAAQRSGVFGPVLSVSGPVNGAWQLDAEIVRLQYEVADAPGRVRFTLRTALIDRATRKVRAAREFDVSVAATEESPYAAVVASNAAVAEALRQLVDFYAAALPASH